MRPLSPNEYCKNLSVKRGEINLKGPAPREKRQAGSLSYIGFYRENLPAKKRWIPSPIVVLDLLLGLLTFRFERSPQAYRLNESTCRDGSPARHTASLNRPRPRSLIVVAQKALCSEESRRRTQPNPTSPRVRVLD